MARKTQEKEIRITLNYNIWCIIISAIVFLILYLLVQFFPNFREIDMNILDSIRLTLTQYPSSIPNFFNHFGRDNKMLWPLIAGCCVLISHRKYINALLLVFFVKMAYFISPFIKDFVCRPRPIAYSGYSFPSTHALTTMVFSGIVIYLIIRYCHSKFWRYFSIIFFSLFTIMVGLSRLWIKVHFLTDVIAGFALGFIIVNLFILISKLFEE